MKILKVAVLLGLSVLASTAMAARPGYTYVSGGFTTQNLSDFCTQDGVWLDGSLSLDGQIFFQAGHADVEGSRCGSTRTHFSVGVRNDYGRSSSAFAKAALIFQRNNGDTDPGVSVTGGLRTMFSNQLELNISLTAEIMDDNDQNYITAGTRYILGRSVSVLGDLSLNDEGDTGLNVGVRFSF